MQAAASKLNVTSEELESFAEYYEALEEASGRPPQGRALSDWKDQCEKVRPIAAVRAFIAASAAQVDAVVPPGSAARRGFEQRLIFMGVYGKTPRESKQPMALEDALAQCLTAAAAKSVGGSAPGTLRVVQGRYDDRHATCREAAYPYQPACSASHGSTTLDCLSDDGLFCGYIAMQGDYADDLCVHPSWHGTGTARTLVCAAAKQLAKAGKKDIFLDVRVCNLPAKGLYESLGFVIEHKMYPSYFVRPSRSFRLVTTVLRETQMRCGARRITFAAARA
eukprot:6606449-Prymnesium_polylepis.1